MKLYFGGRFAEVLGLTILTALSAKATGMTGITVQEDGINPYETPTITTWIDGTGSVTVEVYAGINQLTVDGVQMNGFCVDPYHYSLSSSSGYSYVPLTSAPKDHNMNQTTATDIERLWGKYYSPGMSANDAAGLQIAIWKLVEPALTVNNDYGASVMLGVVEDTSSYTYTGPTADLSALTGPGQDYVVAAPPGQTDLTPVPDSGATVTLLGLALCGLGAVKRFWRFNFLD